MSVVRSIGTPFCKRPNPENYRCHRKAKYAAKNGSRIREKVGGNKCGTSGSAGKPENFRKYFCGKLSAKRNATKRIFRNKCEAGKCFFNFRNKHHFGSNCCLPG